MKQCIAIIMIIVLVLSLGACGAQESAAKKPGSYAVATVNAVGDIFLTDAMLADAKQPDGSYRFSTQFEDVIIPLSQADLTIGNFEGNFTGLSVSAQQASYPQELAMELSRVGFDLLQTANSFSIYNGVSGLERTKQIIEAAGMKALGSYVDAADREKNQVIIREANGLRFAFVAFTKGVGNLSIPSDAACSVDLLYKDYTSDYSEINTSYITNVLQKARDKNPDVIIAAVHWGSENQEEISQTQEEIADLMLKNGVDVIIGSHSHLVGQIERRNVTTNDGVKKECVIAYSLGDFCAVGEGECNSSIILNLEFTRDEEGTMISNVGYMPISAVDRGDSVADRYSVVLTEAEIALYEENYYNRLNESVYEKMLLDLEKIKKKLEPEE